MSKEIKIFLGIGVFFVAVVVGLAFLVGGQSQTTSVVDTQLLVRANSHQTGPATAKVTIVEFGDYECPACGQANPFIEQALKDYAGKINFVFRNYPLPQHTNALISAEAAEAAGDQGKYWEMHNKLFASQSQWANENKPLNTLVGYAQQLGLDTTKFKNDVTGNKYENFIKADQADGDALGIDATPTFFINTTKMVGIGSYGDLKKVIDAELSK